MSENDDFDRKAAEPDAEAAEGQYVEGDYGAAGAAGENPAEAAEGRDTPPATTASAGAAGATAVGAEEGDYPEGDYGAAGGTGAAPAAVEEASIPKATTEPPVPPGPAGRPADTAADFAHSEQGGVRAALHNQPGIPGKSRL